MNVDSLTKILKMTSPNDSLKIRHQVDSDAACLSVVVVVVAAVVNEALVRISRCSCCRCRTRRRRRRRSVTPVSGREAVVVVVSGQW